MFWCEGCGRKLSSSSVTKVGIGMHHRNPNKPDSHLLNCGPVREIALMAGFNMTTALMPVERVPDLMEEEG